MTPADDTTQSPQPQDKATIASPPVDGATTTTLAQSAAPTIFEQWLIKDIRTRKRERIFRWGFRFFIVMLLFAAFVREDVFSGSENNVEHIALVELSGVIGEKITASAAISDIKEAFENKHSKLVILRINSPGGSPVPASQIYQEIEFLRKTNSEKKIYVVVDEMCASGGYYIAAAADKIYANQSSIVGSIGAISASFGYTEVMKKLGIERRVATAGTNKNLNDPFLPASEKSKQIRQSILDGIHLEFISAVRRGRGQRLIENADTFSGRIWLGKDAVKLGLIDAIGSVESVTREFDKDLKVVEYTRDQQLFDRLFEHLELSISSAVANGFYKTFFHHSIQ